MKMSEIPSIHTMGENEYHADPCPEPSLSSGVARTLHERSPLHAWMAHPRFGGQVTVPSQPMLFGSAVHTMVLQPADLQHLTVVHGPDGAYDNWRSKDARLQRDLALASGDIPMLEHEYEAAKELADVIKASKFLRTLHEITPPVDECNKYNFIERAESVITWTEDGAWFRIRPDHFVATDRDVFITDLKTTGVAATPDGWARTMMWNYAMQSGMYRRGLQKLYPDHDVHWTFVVAETDAPYGIASFEFDEQGEEYGNEIIEQAITTWKRCLRNNEWPCYLTNGVFVVETPFYIRNKAGWVGTNYMP